MNTYVDVGTISRWEDIVGNERIKSHFRDLLKAIKIRKLELHRQNMLIVGDSRSGKTSATEFFIKCFHCERLSPTTLNPDCGGQCYGCRSVDSRCGDYGVLARARGTAGESIVKDCSGFRSAEEVRGLVIDAEQSLRPGVVVLDEVSRLEKQSWSNMLLRSLESPGVSWLATTVSADKLDIPFRNRFKLIATQPASLVELMEWTIRRMQRHGITADNETTVLDLVESARAAPGMIVEVLRHVVGRDVKLLTDDDFGLPQ